jgi:hypothetical protein
MLRLTLAFGLVLTLLGLIFYGISGFLSFTALIPSFFGIVFIFLAVVAKNDRYRKTVMHIVSALAFLAFLMTAKSLAAVARWLNGSPPERPLAVTEQAVMSMLGFIFFAVCFRSFVRARRARNA